MKGDQLRGERLYLWQVARHLTMGVGAMLPVPCPVPPPIDRKS